MCSSFFFSSLVRHMACTTQQDSCLRKSVLTLCVLGFFNTIVHSTRRGPGVLPDDVYFKKGDVLLACCMSLSVD